VDQSADTGKICRRPDLSQNLTGLHDARRIARLLLADIVSPGHETIHQSVNFGALIVLLAPSSPFTDYISDMDAILVFVGNSY
jgi:hypothetical protein